MSDYHIKLVSFLWNICPDTLLALFLELAKRDDSQAEFIDLPSYLKAKKEDIIALKSRHLITQGQYDLLCGINEAEEIRKLKLGLLLNLLLQLFRSNLDENSTYCLTEIREVRIMLAHVIGTDEFTEKQFERYWSRLETATLDLAETYLGEDYKQKLKTKFEISKEENCSDDKNKRINWLKEAKDQLLGDIENLNSEIDNTVKLSHKYHKKGAVHSFEKTLPTDPEIRRTDDDLTRYQRKLSKASDVLKKATIEADESNRVSKVSHLTSPDTSQQLIKKDEAHSSKRMKTTKPEMKRMKDDPTRYQPKLSQNSDVLKKALKKETIEADESNRVSKVSHLTSPDTSQQLIKKGNKESAWETVTTVEDAMAVINEDTLPNKHTLCNLIKRLGRGSATVNFVCERICTKIEETTPDVAHVFAAYTVENNQNNVHFVEYFEDVLNTSASNIDYDIVLRNNKCSENESEKIQEVIALSAEESLALKETINAVSKEYMGKYKYLSAITGRKIKFEEGENLCIVLYVHPCTDKYSSIPITEEPLPKEIAGYKVVVRNGVFKAAINTASDHHANLRMGCKITSNFANGYGTLGGFVDHPDYGLCGFTCAHVVFSEEHMANLKKYKRLKMSPSENRCFVHQPSIDSESVGYVVEAFYTDGGDSNTAGVDLALIPINNRPPVSGRSPESNPDEELNYFTGKTLGRSRLFDAEIQKFGFYTGKTTGKIVCDCMAVKELTFRTKTVIQPVVETSQYNQYEIVNDSLNFCEQGDSGALAFATDCSNELVCVGMVTGVLHEIPLHGVVTPITDILRELGVNQLKPFKEELMVDLLGRMITENRREIQAQQETANTQLLSRIETTLPAYINTAIEQRIEGMKEDIKQILNEVQSMKKQPSENNRNDDSSNI